MKWIVSGGGPLIVIDQIHLEYWKGDRNVWEEEDIQEMQAEAKHPLDDYDRACQVDSYIGLIDVGEGNGIVLGDYPLPSTWQGNANLTGGMIIRGGSSVDEHRLNRIILGIHDQDFEIEDFVFDNVSGKAIMFDSGCPGSDLDCLGTGCILPIEIK